MTWRFVGLIILVLLLEAGHAALDILPSSRSVVSALWFLFTSADFWPNLGASLARVSIGLVLAIFFAAILSFLSYISDIAKYLLDGILGLIRPIPPIAWIPLAVAIFGLSDASSIFVIIIGAFFPIFSSSAQALAFEGRAALAAAVLIRGPSLRHFTDIVIPASLPTIFTGLRVAIGFAWMVVVVAEMVAVKSGLGYQIQIERQLLRLDYVVAYMVVIGVVGAALDAAMSVVQAWAMPYRTRPEKARHGFGDAAAPAPADRPPSVDPGPAIHLHGIRHGFGPGAFILADLDLNIAAGELVAVVGGSGSGKTTLLRIIAGEIRPDAGNVAIDGGAGADEPPGWVFQHEGLFAWMSVAKNIEFGIPRDRPKKDYPFDGWLRLAGLSPLAARYPGNLSGGQRQRVQIVRALASRRALVLMDEPFSALDAITREAILPGIRQLFKDSGRTCILVTHDLRDAIKFSDRICVLAEGRIAGEVVVTRASAAGRMPSDTQLIATHFDQVWNLLNGSRPTAPSEGSKI